MEEGPTVAEMPEQKPGNLQTHMGSFNPHPVQKISLLAHFTDRRAEPRRTIFSQCRFEHLLFYPSVLIIPSHSSLWLSG